MSLIVGLTGGVASGKSTVEAAFAALGVPVIDADQVAREVVAPGEPALAEISEAFGAAALLPDGSLDRRYLRGVVFSDEGARKRLEAITHPRIRARLAAWCDGLQAPYGLLSAAILVEAGLHRLCQRVLVVDVPESVQLARLKARDGTDETLARKMLAAQASREARLQAADDVLRNDGAAQALPALVARLHERYLHLASVPVEEASCAPGMRLP